MTIHPFVQREKMWLELTGETSHKFCAFILLCP